jgi:hypothetical protein
VNVTGEHTYKRQPFPKVADQDDVAALVSLRQQQLLAVARPGEIMN